MDLDFSQIVPSIPYMLMGIFPTMFIVIFSLMIGITLGVLLSLCKISRNKALEMLADAYTSVFRGTPLVLQLMLIYYGIPQVLGIETSAFASSIVAFGLNSAAYISEIIKAGILSIDKGQLEASKALGMPYPLMMKKIILPQAVKNILPALMNEVVSLTKESAIVTVIGVNDLMRRAYIVGGATYAYLEPLIFVGCIYFLIVLVLTQIGKKVERKMNASA